MCYNSILTNFNLLVESLVQKVYCRDWDPIPSFKRPIATM